jgi:hypothetical protein
MICTSYYSGPEARQDALQLVNELRTNYRLPAYVFNYSDQERLKEQERLRQEKERIHQLLEQQARVLGDMGATQTAPVHVRTRRFEEQCAVLIGGYADEKKARKDLDRIKALKPPDPKRVKLASIVQIRQKEGEQIWVSPFAHAFVVPNPMIKKAPAANKNQPDPLLKELNAGESYSLLQCPKRFTLAVSEFHGVTTLQEKTATSRFLSALHLGGGSGEALNASALNAHNVAEALRKLNFQAYVLHTRFYSLVTVGGYDTPDDPRLKADQNQLVQLAPKLQPLPMLPEPLPLEIPRP